MSVEQPIPNGAAAFKAITEFAEQSMGVTPQTAKEVEFFARKVCAIDVSAIKSPSYKKTVENAQVAAKAVFSDTVLQKPVTSIPSTIIERLTAQSSPSLKKAAALVDKAKTGNNAKAKSKNLEKAAAEIRQDFVKGIVKDVKPPPIIVGDILAVVDGSRNLARYLQVKMEVRNLESEHAKEYLRNAKGGKDSPDELAQTEKLKSLKSEIESRKKEIGLLKKEVAAGALGTMGVLSGSTAQLGGAGVTLAQKLSEYVGLHPFSKTAQLVGTPHVSAHAMVHAAAQLGAIVAGGAIAVGVIGGAVTISSLIDTRMAGARLEGELEKLNGQKTPETSIGKLLVNLRKDNIESHQKVNIKNDVWKHRLTLAMYATCIAVGSMLLAGVACTPYGILAIGLTAAIVGGIMWKRKRAKYMQGDMGRIVKLQTEILELQQQMKADVIEVDPQTGNVKGVTTDEILKLQRLQNTLKQLKMRHKLECEASPAKREMVKELFIQINASLSDETRSKAEKLKLEITGLKEELEGIGNPENGGELILRQKEQELAKLGPIVDPKDLIKDLEEITGGKVDLSAFKKDSLTALDRTRLKEVLTDWISNTDTNFPDMPVAEMSKKEFVLNKLKMAVSS